MDDVKQILVVSRLTTEDEKAVHYGVSLCKKYGAELNIIHVINDPLLGGGWNLPIPAIEEAYRESREEARKALDRITGLEREKGMTINELIRDGEPSREVFKAVEEMKIDLIVMVSHEEGRLEHFLFGRTNERIIRRMPCSVFLVKKEPEAADFE
ncbi:MAG: universal stress protein [Candidatus Sulfobium sp.]|jgi:universal stress protein A